MRVRIPEKLPEYDDVDTTHDDIIRAIKELNPQLEIPSRTSWKEGLPDLEEPLAHIAVEVELTSLRNGWGQCLYYHRQGSPEIHLILAPQLYGEYKEKEQTFVKENPIPNAVVHKLPKMPKTFSHKAPEPEEEEEEPVKRKSKEKPNVSGLLNNWDEMILLPENSELYFEIMAEARVCDESIYLSQHGEGWSTSVRVGILVDGGMQFNRINHSFIRPKKYRKKKKKTESMRMDSALQT